MHVLFAFWVVLEFENIIFIKLSLCQTVPRTRSDQGSYSLLP